MTLDLDALERLEPQDAGWRVREASDHNEALIVIDEGPQHNYFSDWGQIAEMGQREEVGTANARYIVALREAAPQLIAIARAAGLVEAARRWGEVFVGPEATDDEIAVFLIDQSAESGKNDFALPTPAEERSNG